MRDEQEIDTRRSVSRPARRDGGGTGAGVQQGQGWGQTRVGRSGSSGREGSGKGWGSGLAVADQAAVGCCLDVGDRDLELDEATHEVRRAGELLDLSPTEFALLRYLIINADRVVSKAQILDHVWQYDFRGDMGIVETYISYLRKKVDSFDPPLIHTVRGVGYRLRMPPK